MSRNYIFSPPKRLYVMLWDSFTFFKIKAIFSTCNHKETDFFKHYFSGSLFRIFEDTWPNVFGVEFEGTFTISTRISFTCLAAVICHYP
jgi:hypothetical protein